MDTKKISDQAMLVGFAISHYTFRKLEKRAAEVVEEKFHAREGVIRSTKSMIAKRHLTNIVKCVGDARTYHYKMTADYPVKGYSILSCKLFTEYMAEMNKYISKFNTMVEEFIDVYPDAKEEAREDQGTLYDELEYPNVSDLYKKFHMGVRFAPIPEGSALHVTLSNEDLEQIQLDIEADVRRTFEAAMMDIWGRLHTSMTAIKERMTPDGDKAKLFRDSLIMNLRELVQILPKMNFTNDPELTKIADEIEHDLASYDPEELRTVPENRQDALEKAEGYLKRMEPFVNPKAEKKPKVAALVPRVMIPVVAPVVVLEPEPEPVKILEPVKVEVEEEIESDIVKKLREQGII